MLKLEVREAVSHGGRIGLGSYWLVPIKVLHTCGVCKSESGKIRSGDSERTQRFNSDAENETVFYYIRNHSSEKKENNQFKKNNENIETVKFKIDHTSQYFEKINENVLKKK